MVKGLAALPAAAPPSWSVCSDAQGRYRQEGSEVNVAKMGSVNACTAAGGRPAYGNCLDAIPRRPSNN